MLEKKIRVAIIGTGNIGTDLCSRILKEPNFEIVAFVGRRVDSPGLLMFKKEIKQTQFKNKIDPQSKRHNPKFVYEIDITYKQ